MTKQLQQKLSDSKGARWLALFLVSVTMMCAYFLTDVISPLEKFLTEENAVVYLTNSDGKEESMSLKELSRRNAEAALEDVNTTDVTTNLLHDVAPGQDYAVRRDDGTKENLKVASVVQGKGWTSKAYGFFSGSYAMLNIFLLMLFFGGLILDKMGIRFTGIMSASFMLVGVLIKYYAITHSFDFSLFGYPGQVVVAALGFAVFGMGAEIAGVTVSKIIVKWFAGKELALAMGLQVALARLGMAFAFVLSLPVAKSAGDISASILVGLAAISIGFLFYLIYCVMDKKEDASIKESVEESSEEGFQLKDLGVIFGSPGFWLITLLCLMFYGAVFPFMKYATNLMIYKYGVEDSLAGLIPAMLPFGTILLTPIFGTIYDRVGKGATLMLIGSLMLTLVHVIFTLPIEAPVVAIANMLLLGIAFSLVPSAMWPSVPKIVPMKQLGTAYASIFFIQNIGLMIIPMLIGVVIDSVTTENNGVKEIDYTLPMSIFAAFGVAAVLLAIALLAVNKKKGYGLEEANVKK